MKSSQFNELFSEVVKRLRTIFDTKGIDYAGLEDRLANFKSGKKYGLDSIQTLAIYRMKHTTAIDTWIVNRILKGEPVEDKLIDEIAYDMLLLALIVEMYPEQTKIKIKST